MLTCYIHINSVISGSLVSSVANSLATLASATLSVLKSGIAKGVCSGPRRFRIRSVRKHRGIRASQKRRDGGVPLAGTKGRATHTSKLELSVF